jgi:hypothetical protein
LSSVRYELERQLTHIKEKQTNGKEVQDWRVMYLRLVPN